MCLNSFLKASKSNKRISKSRAFHNVGAAYTKDLSKNKLAHVLLIGGTHNKQGSKDARVRIVVLLTLSLIKSHKYSGAVLNTVTYHFQFAYHRYAYITKYINNSCFYTMMWSVCTLKHVIDIVVFPI